jgi:hypothetical protein
VLSIDNVEREPVCATSSHFVPSGEEVACAIYVQATLTKMCLRYYQGEPMEKTLAWAEGECEGYMRT